MKKTSIVFAMALCVASTSAHAGDSATEAVQSAGVSVPGIPVKVFHDAVVEATKPAPQMPKPKAVEAQKPEIKPVTEQIVPRPSISQAEKQVREMAVGQKDANISVVPAEMNSQPQQAQPDNRPADFNSKLDVTMEPGVNEIVKISRGHLNRIVTPFDHVAVRTVSNANISTDGGIMYIDAAGDMPVTMFLSEKGDSSVSLSLTMIPDSIPPREIRLVVPNGAAYATKKAERWETGKPYEEGIKDTMKTIAMGDVPSGYGMRAPSKFDFVPDCQNEKQGVSITPGQVIEGHNIIYIVSAMKNISAGPVEFSEALCFQPGVLAVASWPKVILKPGEETELYVAIKRPEVEPEDRRPSLIAGGN